MKKESLLILITLICTNLWSQKSLLQGYVEGYENEEKFAREHRIKSIKITQFKAKKNKLKKMKVVQKTEYNTHGKVTYFKEYLRKRGKYTEIQNRIYDSNNRLIKMKTQKNYAKDYTIDYSMKYNADSSLVWIDVIEGPRDYKWNYTVNYILSKENETIAEIRKEGDTIYYNRNKIGKLINTSKIKNDTVNLIIYDEKGNLLENNYIEDVKHKYHFDTSGNCIKSEYFIKINDTVKLESWRTLEYDKDGKLLKVIIFNGNDKIEEFYNYTFDGTLRKTKEYFNEKGKLYKVDKYEYTFYD